MVSITGLTADKMAEIDGLSLIDADVVGTDLILTKRNMDTINAGNVKGLTGASGLTSNYYYARSNSSLSLVNTAITTVDGWAFYEGLPTLVSISSGTNFTINQAGIYLIYFSLTFNSGANSRRIPFIYKGSTELRRVDLYSYTGGMEYSVSHFCMLNVGDVITFKAYQNSGAALTLAGSNIHDATLVKIA